MVAAVTLPSRSKILSLYRHLLRYSQSLTLTDQNFVKNRIRAEFDKHRELSDHKEIAYYLEVKLQFFITRIIGTKIISIPERRKIFEEQTFNMNVLRLNLWTRRIISSPKSVNLVAKRQKQTIDYSKVPVINEDELEEEFVRGSGPGGQAVNKTSNCVVLKHLPTGIVVKCHQTRSQIQNRKLARDLLQNKLDERYNGETSVAAQKENIEKKKNHEKLRRQKLRLEMKLAFKEREGLK